MSKATVTDAHQEMARDALACSYPQLIEDAIAQAIADAEARGFEAGGRAAANLLQNYVDAWCEAGVENPLIAEKVKIIAAHHHAILALLKTDVPK